VGLQRSSSFRRNILGSTGKPCNKQARIRWQEAISSCSLLLTHFLHTLHFDTDGGRICFLRKWQALIAACFLLISYLAYSLTLNLEAIYFSETPRFSELYNPVDRNLHSHRCENMNSNYMTYDCYLPSASHPSHRRWSHSPYDEVCQNVARCRYHVRATSSVGNRACYIQSAGTVGSSNDTLRDITCLLCSVE
jgi:hypothetical protein